MVGGCPRNNPCLPPLAPMAPPLQACTAAVQGRIGVGVGVGPLQYLYWRVGMPSTSSSVCIARPPPHPLTFQVRAAEEAWNGADPGGRALPLGERFAWAAAAARMPQQVRQVPVAGRVRPECGHRMGACIHPPPHTLLPRSAPPFPPVAPKAFPSLARPNRFTVPLSAEQNGLVYRPVPLHPCP
jgi:hypothetical protein